MLPDVPGLFSTLALLTTVIAYSMQRVLAQIGEVPRAEALGGLAGAVVAVMVSRYWQSRD